MGKKSKTGKHRLDTFYQRAKEAGYRARSAYKLIQLNRKFNFLENSRVCIDLCAAPGSWMQVAQKHMPVSSVIVGVDLVPIKPIPHTIGITGDITTEKVRQELRGQLKTWKADVVLHDGAPNVGQNWIHDAYQQNLLTLHAFKLACEFLRKGGVFVTKVFRSKDYYSLEYCFRKLFKKVESTKPQASRYESAEIFVVCTGFQAPDRIDAQFFDAKSVFQELDAEPVNKLDLLKPVKKKPKPHGYVEGDYTLFNSVPMSKFLHSDNHLAVLQEASALTFDDDDVLRHPLTTAEVVECCKDIKVLGRRELRLLITWRKNFRAALTNAKKAAEGTKEEVEEERNSEEEDEKELKKVEEHLTEMQVEKARDEKRKKRKVAKEKSKLEERMRLNVKARGDEGPVDKGGDGLFSISILNKVQDLDTIVDQAADIVVDEIDSGDEDLRREVEGPKVKFVRFDKEDTHLEQSGRYYKHVEEYDALRDNDASDSDDEVGGLRFKDDGEEEEESMDEGEDKEGDDSDEGDENNPLLTDLVGDEKEMKRVRRAENWFNKDVFKDLETEADEDYEIDTFIEKYKKTGGVMRQDQKEKSQPEEENNNKKKSKNDVTGDSSYSSDDDSSDEDSDDETEKGKQPELIGGMHGNRITDDNAAAGGAPPRKNKKRKLDSVGLALATEYIRSKKSKRDLLDGSWNRYTFGDEILPEWFEKDEQKYNNPSIVVSAEDLKMYKERLRDVDSRTIKKVVEAKARKKRRVKKRMARARKKSEVITNNEDMSEREKSQEVKKLYKKAMAPVMKKKEAKYVVMKRQNSGHKPAGTKGPYKLVDRRLKKDKRPGRVAAKQSKGKGSKGGRKQPKGKGGKMN